MTTSRPGRARAALLTTLLLFAALATGAPASAPATKVAKRCPAKTAHSRATTTCPAVKPKPKRYPKVLVPEMNLGQLSKLVRAEFLVDAQSLTKVQGLPFSATEIKNKIMEMIDA